MGYHIWRAIAAGKCQGQDNRTMGYYHTWCAIAAGKCPGQDNRTMR